MKTIVIIDDDSCTIELLHDALTLEGFQVEVAGNGEAGLELVSLVRPDLVICDMLLPRLDGLGVAAALAADPVHRAIPILLMSASPQVFTALEAANRHCLAKPLSLRTLVATVCTLTGALPAL